MSRKRRERNGPTWRRGEAPGDKPHIEALPNGHGYICRQFLDTGTGDTPQLAYLDMVIRADERERNRRCF